MFQSPMAAAAQNRLSSFSRMVEKISGTFKGPRQSGTIDGTVAGNNIMFHVTAKMPLDYKGTISDDTTKMQGTFEGDGKTGDWNASRSQ